MLIISTSWWPFTARLAIEFAELGLRVEAACPIGHPLRHTQSVSRIHPYGALDPLQSIVRAIRHAKPLLVIPCDDRAVSHLHTLHAQGDRETADLIERSLGHHELFGIVDSRPALIDAALAAGLVAPEMYQVSTRQELLAALDRVDLPAVLKVDGTWGGLGVVVVDTAEQAIRMFEAMRQPLSTARALKRLIIDRDPFHILPWFRRTVPMVSVQRYVRGRPANGTAACWKGEILAMSTVEVVQAQGPLGASTLVRLIDRPDMTSAIANVVKWLGLSGFCGVDFMIGTDDDRAHLIELNPRCTPLSPIRLGEGRDLVAALVSRVTNASLAPAQPVTQKKMIAFFPQAWHHNPALVVREDVYHDVPWRNPDLLSELMQDPWPDRGQLHRLMRAHRSNARSKAGSNAASAEGYLAQGSNVGSSMHLST